MPTKPQYAESTPSEKVIVVGESVIDCWPDGRTVIGGAPLNVAWHLRGLGLDPLFVSAVGQDAAGKEILDYLHRGQVRTSEIQRVPEKPTGIVNVLGDGDAPTYQIADDVAYDYIQFPASLAGNDPPMAEFDQPDQRRRDLLYYGTLCYRRETTRSTLQRLRRERDFIQFVDVNYREGHVPHRFMPEILFAADHLKCNMEELVQLQTIEGHANAGSAPKSNPLSMDPMGLARDLLQRWQLDSCWVTDGEKGAYWISHTEEHCFVSAGKIDTADFADSVGAGDAFASVILRGIARHQHPQQVLAEAVQFAGRVCTLDGATTDRKQFYDDFISQQPS